MKKSTAISLAIATSLLTGSAFAAPTKKPAKKPSAKQNVTLESTPSSAKAAPTAAPAEAETAPAPVAAAPAASAAPVGSAPTPPQSVVSAGAPGERLIDKMSLALISGYYGPALSKFDRYTPDDKGGGGTLQHFENSLRLGYKLTPDVSLAVSYEHFIYPASGFEVTTQDPYLRIAHSKIFSLGDFNYSADFRYYAPTTATSQARGQIAQLRTNQTFGYTLGRWTFGAYGTIRRYVYNTQSQVNIVGGKEIGIERRTWRAYVGPYLNFQITDKLALTSIYEAEGKQLESHKWNDWESAGTDLEVGFNYDFTPKFSVNPYIQIYPHADKINADNTMIGASISASFL